MIYLKNAAFVDWRTLEIRKIHLKVEDGIDGKIHFLVQWPSKEEIKNQLVIDCKNKIVTKSFGCGHHHVYSALATGMGKPRKNPENFYEILKFIWWTLDKCLDLDMVRASAYATAIICAKNGVTFAIDHHASPNAIEGSLETIAQAFDAVGVGHLLCYEITDRDGVDHANMGLKETDQYLKNHQGLVGLHASFTLTKGTLKHAVGLAEKHNSGIHVHVAEDLYDQDNCYELYNKRVVERFEEYGILKLKKSIFAHCLYLTQHERELISRSGIYVVQNTESNLNNNVGYFRSNCLGDRIMLGTDGMHSDMLRSMKAAYFVGQGFDSVDMAGAYDRFRKIHDYLKEHKFKGDGDNNLVILDYQPHTLMNSKNFLGHLLFSIDSRHVHQVISQGKLIVDRGQILTVDEEKIFAESRKLSKLLWQKMKKVKYRNSSENYT